MSEVFESIFNKKDAQSMERALKICNERLTETGVISVFDIKREINKQLGWTLFPYLPGDEIQGYMFKDEKDLTDMIMESE